MSDLQAIADRVEIEALRGEFTDASLMRDWDRFASLFTEDGAWRMPHINEELVGREEIRAGIERLQGRWDYFVQTVHPGTIQLGGDTAVGRAYVSEFGRLRDAIGHLRDGSSYLNYSVYHDPLPGHSGRLEVQGAPLRDQIRRHHSSGGLGASRSGERPLTREDLLQAVADALVEFPADALILDANWRERRFSKKVRERFGLPVTEVTLNREGQVLSVTTE